MFTRTGWFVIALTVVLLVSGALLRYRELVVIGVALLACILLAAIWGLFRPRLEVRRDVIPQRIEEGETAAAILTVTNLAKRGSPGVLARDYAAGRWTSIPVPALGSSQSFTTSYQLQAERRGIYTVGPLSISHSDPLRLVQLAQGVGAETELIIHPRKVRVSPLPTGHSQEIEGPTQAGAPRGGIAFHSLREYVPGDDLRLIHWLSTARTDTLMVRHTVITNEPRLMIVLDTAASSYAHADEFEDAVRIVASLVAAGSDQRYPVEFHTTGGAIGAVDPTGRGETALFDTLAAVETTNDDPGLTQLGKLVTRQEHGVSLGVVTGLPDPERVTIVARVASRYEMATLVQVGDHLRHPPVGLSGVLSMAVENLTDFANVWKARVG